MKIYELDDEIMVDSIPTVFDPNKKIFLTTLVHIEKHKLPKCIPKIYTSKALKLQFLQFLKSKGIEFEDENFHIWKPFEPEIITLKNGTSYEVLPCCPQDNSTNMLLVFRKDSVITHVYVGLCSELRSTLLNKTLLSWLRKNSLKSALYIPFSDASKRCPECEFQKAVIDIEQRVNADNVAKVLIQLPLFGSESFIAKVASEFQGSVALCGKLKRLYMISNSGDMTCFTEDFKLARIIITGGDVMEVCTTNMKRNYDRLSETHTMKWSPLPSCNELNLLIDLVRPKKVYGITFNNSHADLDRPVKISNISFDSNINSEGLMLESLQRKSANSVHCCLEKYQQLGRQVIDNVKGMINDISQKQKSEKSEDRTEEQSTTSSHLKNPSLDKANSVHFQDNREELPPQQIEIQSATIKVESEESEYVVETISQSQCSSKATNAELSQKTHSPIQQKTLEQTVQVKPCKILCKKIPKRLLSKYQQKQPTNSLNTQNHQRSPCPPMSSLVYRKGKKGIVFVDEDSSSS